MWVSVIFPVPSLPWCLFLPFSSPMCRTEGSGLESEDCFSWGLVPKIFGKGKYSTKSSLNRIWVSLFCYSILCPPKLYLWFLGRDLQFPTYIFFNLILFIFLYSRFLLVIHFIRISVYMSIPISQFITPPPQPPPLPPLASIRLFSTSVLQFLPCKPVHLYHFSRFHIYVLIYNMCFSPSD